LGAERVQTTSISVADILGRPGELKDHHIAPVLDGIETALARVTGEPLDVRVRAESVHEGVLFTGRVSGRAALTCARCLKPLEDEVSLEVRELYFVPGHRQDPEEGYELKGMEADLEPMLRDAVTLALPLNPLCRADCKGLCAGCGADLNTARCTCRNDDMDPRWAPLAALRERLEAG
jgi:uncharacterized protein